MANTINLDAEVGANYIGDDAQPSIRLENASTGPGLSVDKLVTTSQATIVQANINPAILAANATIVGINLGTTSVASGAAIALKGGAYVSAVSLIFAAGAGWAGMGVFRIVRSDGTFGWVPVLPDAQVTAAAV